MRLKTTVTRKANLDASGLNVLEVLGEKLAHAVYEDLKLDALSIAESHLTDCVFRNIVSKSTSCGGGRKQTVYRNCLLENCDLEFAVVGNARFIGCEFRSSKLTRILGVSLELIDCRFPGTRVQSSVFHRKVPVNSPVYAQRTMNEFRGNDLSSAELVDTDFRGGIELEEKRLPCGRGYLLVKDIPEALQAGEELKTRVIEPSDQKRLQKFMRRLTFAGS